MANEQNIIPHQFTSDQDRDKAKKNGAKGGKASGKARREKRLMKERLEMLLEITLKPGKATDLKKVKSLDKETMKQYNLTAGDAIAIALTHEAMKGKVQAWEAIRDQLGEKPVEEHKIAVAIDEDKALEAWIKKLKEDKELKESLRDGD